MTLSNPPAGNGPMLLGIVWTFTTLALMSMLLRLYVRCFVIRAAGRDDYVIALCFFLNIANASLVTVGICYGLGQHDSDLSLYDISKASEFAVISTVFIVFYIIILKLPILFLIERIFNVPKFHRIIFYGMMFILAALGISDVAVQFAQCTPSRGLWEPWLKPVCWTNGNIVPAVAITFSAWSAFIDFVLATYPATRLRSLKMKMSKKIEISVLMGLGAIAAIIAIAKCPTLTAYGNTGDFLYAFTDVTILTDLEINFLCLAACAPTLGPLFRTDSVHARKPSTMMKYLMKLSTVFSARSRSSRTDEMTGGLDQDSISLEGNTMMIERDVEFSTEARERLDKSSYDDETFRGDGAQVTSEIV